MNIEKINDVSRMYRIGLITEREFETISLQLCNIFTPYPLLSVVDFITDVILSNDITPERKVWLLESVHTTDIAKAKEVEGYLEAVNDYTHSCYGVGNMLYSWRCIMSIKVK